MVDFAAAGTTQETILELIARTIADRLKPRRVILIGSRARGDARPDSDYDVVIEFATDSKTATDLANQAYSLFPDRGWELNVIPRVTGEIERSADDPGTIDWDIVREGKILYSADASYKLPTPGASRVREKRDEPPESLAQWIKRARGDAQVAQLLIRNEWWDHACFHAQQSAEKYLKGVLVRLYVHPPQTHDLKELLSVLRKRGIQLAGIDDDCALLTPFAVATRYGSPRCDGPMADEALLAAERIAAAAVSVLGEDQEP